MITFGDEDTILLSDAIALVQWKRQAWGTTDAYWMLLIVVCFLCIFHSFSEQLKKGK